MAELTGIHVFKRGYKDPVYVAARQYMALEKSIKQLEDSLKSAEFEGYGQQYKNLIMSRIAENRQDMYELEKKFSLDKIEEFKI